MADELTGAAAATPIPIRIVGPPPIERNFLDFYHPARLCLPSQVINHEAIYSHENQMYISDLNQFEITCNPQFQEGISIRSATPITVLTSDGTPLSGYGLIYPSQRHLPPNEQKWLVNFTPNASCVESELLTFKKISEHLAVNVLMTNYRGVGGSLRAPKQQVTTADDMILDGFATISHLLSKGIPANNIVAIGFSIGGAIATYAAAKFPGLNLGVINSFHKLSAVPLHKFRNSDLARVSSVLSLMAWHLIELSVLSQFGELDSGKAISGVTGKIIISQATKDPIIEPGVQLIRKIPAHLNPIILGHDADRHIFNIGDASNPNAAEFVKHLNDIFTQMMITSP